MTISPEQLDEHERIGRAATSAPWIGTGRNYVYSQWEPEKRQLVCVVNAELARSVRNEADRAQWIDDVSFVIHARNNWQSLVDEIRRLRERENKLRNCLEEWVNLRPALVRPGNRGSDWPRILYDLLDKSEGLVEETDTTGGSANDS